MMCPTCGVKGRLEQVEFSPQRELLHCSRCNVTYVVYPVGNGNYTEPVPFQKHPTHP